MKKVGLLLMVLFLFSAFVVTKSEAGQICWGMDIYSDIIKVSQLPTGNGHKLVNGVWFASTYNNPVVGTMEWDTDGISKRLSLHATNNTVSFGGFKDCVLDADLSSSSTPKWEGPAIIDCGSGGYPVSGFNLIRIDCTTLQSLSGTSLNAGLKGLGE